jgi:FkbM family methyltransferase
MVIKYFDKICYALGMSTLRALLKQSRLAIHLYRLMKIVLLDPVNHGRRFYYFRRYLWWFCWARPRGQQTMVKLENGMLSRVYPDSDSGVSNIFTRNVDYFENQLIRSVLQPGDFIVDAGCNVGNRTLVLADVIGGALMLDANPLCLERVQENFQLNQIDMRHYTLRPCAVGAVEGMLFFSDLGGTYCSNQIVPAGTPQSLAVPVTTLDQELQTLNQNACRFIKLDLEGYDLDGLRGSLQTLRSGQLRLIKFERWQSVPLQDFIDFFAAEDWIIFALDDVGRPTRHWPTVASRSNLFAMPETAWRQLNFVPQL